MDVIQRVCGGLRVARRKLEELATAAQCGKISSHRDIGRCGVEELTREK